MIELVICIIVGLLLGGFIAMIIRNKLAGRIIKWKEALAGKSLETTEMSFNQVKKVVEPENKGRPIGHVIQRLNSEGHWHFSISH